MKRIQLVTTLLLILTFYQNKTIAQLPPSINYYFCALNGTCFNEANNNNPNVSLILEEYSPQEALAHTIAFMIAHPQFTLVAPASQLYNCHGFAYSVFQGGEKLKIDWDDRICSFNGSNIESYIQINNNLIQTGDIATIVDPDDNGTYSIHSSIVVNSDTVISKWGHGPLFKHHKNDSWIASQTGLGISTQYVYYHRVINNEILGPETFNGTGTYTFYYDVLPTTCTWNVEPAAMFQVSSGSGSTANLSYKTPFEHLAPKATLTFTFSYGCDNHYNATKEIDLRIPTTTISGNAISESFVIDNNAVVTVTGKIKSNSNAKTIVPVGTKLVLDGGIMTSNGGVMWQGIEVWGNSSTHQATINGVCGQGFLELKNGAVIENAKCAVELWRPGYYSTTGGIIHASNAVFRNNAMAVRALYYTNHNPYTPSPIDYNAYFNNCSFVIDGSYLGMEAFVKHVVLLEIDGIEFKGCDFSANRSVSGVDPWCIGISSYDAGFTVTASCTTNNNPCPWEEMDHSTFTGLCAGITATGSGNNPHTFVVRDAVFNNNDYGVNVLNTNFPTINSNEFNIGGGGYCDFNYGICLRNCTSFCVEENHFQPVVNATETTVGVAIYHSNSVNDVYRNTFEDLLRGSLALGQNTNGQAGALQGLTYTCNVFDGNQRDIMVLQRDGAGDIQSQQGSSASPAGNRFLSSTFQIFNDGLNPTNITYYYDPNGLNETPTTSMLYRVTPQTANGTNYCNSHYGNNPVVKSPSEKAELASDYFSAYNAYLDLKRLYESHMDDSDTEDPTADNSPTAEMLQIGAQMAQYSHEYTLAAGDIIRSNLNDSVANSTELRTWLRNMHDIAADRMIISSYIQDGDSANAFALANTLPALYDLQGDQLTDHSGYIRLISLYQALHRSGRNIFQLTETETDLVRDMAENGTGVSQFMAEAIMEQITDRGKDACFIPELPNGGDESKGTMTHSNITEKEEKVLNVSVAPNPATTWTTVNYSLPKQGTKALLTLTNVLGVNVLSVELEGAQGSKVLDLRGLAAGVYVYTIRYEQFTEIGKLVIR